MPLAEPPPSPTGGVRPANILFATIITRSHLPRARVLMASIKHVHPEAGCHVLLIDGDATHAKSEDAFTAHTWRELGLHGYLRRAFVNSAGGLCCMLKPVFVAWLLRQQQAEAVIYTDADTRFYNTTDHLVRAAINASFNLTPHILSPLSTPSPLRSDAAIARAGTYNGGLFTARRDASALAILDWWAESMWREAWLDHAYAWDQIWLSLLRQLFPATCVFSHPSHNVAYWNLDQRPLVLDAQGRFKLRDGDLLSHFHFSLFDPDHPGLLVRHHAEKIPPPDAATAKLCADYAAELRAADSDRASTIPYGFARFHDGAPITPRHRNFYRFHLLSPPDEEHDPFDPHYAVGNHRGINSLYRSQTPSARVRRAVLRALKRVFPAP
jgi:hypothetical protein